MFFKPIYKSYYTSKRITIRFLNAWKERRFVYWIQFSIVSGNDELNNKSIRFFFGLFGFELKMKFVYGRSKNG